MNDSEYPFEVRVDLLLINDDPAFQTCVDRMDWTTAAFGDNNFQTIMGNDGFVIYKFRNEPDASLFALRWS